MKHALQSLPIIIAFIGCAPTQPMKNYFHEPDLATIICDSVSIPELQVLSTFWGLPKQSDTSYHVAFFDSTIKIDADQDYLLSEIDRPFDTTTVKGLIREFNQLNSRRYTFCPMLLPTKRKIHIILKADFDSALSDKDFSKWQLLHEQYPNVYSIVSYSRVAFTSDMSMAMVFVSDLLYPSGGAGYYYILKHCGNEWFIWQSVNKWIS